MSPQFNTMIFLFLFEEKQIKREKSDFFFLAENQSKTILMFIYLLF